MKHSTFAVHTHTFLATGPSQVGKWPTWWYCFTETPPYAVCVHFYRFMELTINPHTNLYNLASGKPRLLRAWDPLVPYNYCFWSPWLWDVSLAEEMNVELRGGECFVQEDGLFGTSKHNPCRIQTLHRFLRIHNSTDEGPRLHIKHALTRSLLHW